MDRYARPGRQRGWLAASLLALLPVAAPAGTLVRANLHVHTSAGVAGAESPAATVAQAAALDLGCVALTDPVEGLTPEGWEAIQAAAADPPAGLVALLGQQWSGAAGHIQTLDCVGFIQATGPVRLPRASVIPELDAFYVALLERLRPQRLKVPIAQFSGLAQDQDFLGWRPGPLPSRTKPVLQLAELATAGATPAETRAGEAVWRRALSRGWALAPTFGADNSGPLTAAHRRSHTGIYLATANPPAATSVLGALMARRLFASQDANAELELRIGEARMGEDDVLVTSPVVCTVRYRDPDGTDSAPSLVLVLDGTERPIVTTPVNEGGFLVWRPSFPVPLGRGWVYARLKQSDGDLLYTAPVWFEAPEYVPVAQWGSYGSAPGQFRHPKGIAVNRFGEVYVADTYNCRLEKFAVNGRLIATWGEYGTRPRRLRFPRGLATDATGAVYVADTYNHRIQKFTRRGAFVAAWGGLGGGDGRFRYPAAVAVDADRNLYVADAGNHRVQKLTASGDFVRAWGGYGTGPGQLRNPLGLALDPQGRVIVADTHNHRLQVFSADGEYLARIGTRGMRDGDLEWPCGVASDSSGRILVADEEWNRVLAYGPQGDRRGGLGSLGTAVGLLLLPGGVAVGPDDRVYVADTGNGRVQVFARAVQSTAISGGTVPLALQGLVATPTRAGAAVAFTLSAPAAVTVEVRNLAGRLVRRLAQASEREAGTTTMLWDGRSDRGPASPPGPYVVYVLARSRGGRQISGLCRVHLGR